MPQFKDKATAIKNGKEAMTYSDLIKICLGNAPAQGLNIEQMRKHMAILEKFDKMKDGKVSFDELEMIVIRGSVSSFPWAFVHKDIVDLASYLDALK
jgi:hypothetical protein